MTDLLPFEDRSADLLRLVLDNSQTGIWELDLASGRAVRNRMHDRIFGYDQPLDEWSYDRFLGHVVEKDRLRVDNLQKTAIEESREWTFDCQIRTARGEIRWIKASGRPLLDKNGQPTRLIGHVIDITDAKQNEARLRLVTEELNHRVRNMLSIVKSMISLTARTAESTDAFACALEGRVAALARTQNLIVGEESSAMMPSAIVEAELATFPAIEDRVRITVNGEEQLTATAGQGLALVTHELLTNAIKHGALSSETGRVAVTIGLSGVTTQITWLERGGPAPPEHRQQGFGSMLILDALAGEGTTEQIFSPEGLECRITLKTR
ncbi:HWE histidine kinase domain-containing protein [Porphyrobacter sp. YT40]|uniref:sensor histidine kinase n=1 Tax=Porphyrobacter sp. YT40 TaxID=2547601 RepID=UPI001144A2F6|nr:HWE histidine kinase domain-containing protein [Porphyrobacter sp. YT40]QDH33627.1 PAS domain S-box protein [Porphyrobacter sp. YT40]